MQLPQEIYDLIIDHLYKDRPTLSHCALVSRAWVDRSQTHFFRSVILKGKRLQLWVDKFSPSDGRIHSFVKNLELWLPHNAFEYFKEHALAFKRLESLTIKGGRQSYRFQLFLGTHWFSHLRDSLRSLQLEDVVLSPRIIAGFPRLEFLVVRNSALHTMDDTNKENNAPVEGNPHGAFKGSLAFYTESGGSGILLLGAFPDCPLGYDTIRIDVTGYTWYSLGEPINRFISRCSSTLEVLDINFQDQSLCSGLNLSPFKRLREISLTSHVSPTSQPQFPRFSAITSGTMSKIMIVFEADTHAEELFGRFKEGHCWSGVNEDLARLAEFQGGSGSRRVEFVVDLRRVRFGSSSWKEKRFERDCWIQLASRYALAKFAQAGKIDFILPSLRARLPSLPRPPPPPPGNMMPR